MANYGSDDEEKSSDSSDSSSSDDSDVDIQNRLKKKKKSFERLEADILENCDALEKDYEDREKKWKAGIPNQGRFKIEAKRKSICCLKELKNNFNASLTCLVLRFI